MPTDVLIQEPTATTEPSAVAAVKLWTQRIRDAKRHWDPDFKRMLKNMEFVAGFQWLGQTEMDDDRYTANMTLRTVNQKVASLYARDPKAIARRRKRLDYQIWDGKVESLQQAILGAQAGDLASLALILDYTEGRRQRDMVDRVGQTLEIVYQWMCDISQPGFKRQMKQLVRRTATCGVGYVRLNFERMSENDISATDTKTSIVDLVKRAKSIMLELQEGEIELNSPRMQELKQLLMSINVESQATQNAVQEQLVFDFPCSTSVIVDPRCTALEGFVGANWIALERHMPISEVNEFFEVQIKKGDGLEIYPAVGEQLPSAEVSELPEKELVRLWEVFDHRTKCCFFIVDGWKDYVQQPEPAYPKLNGFWPVFALTFNDVETEPDAKSTIFPPSDVQLMKSPQREWNKSRESLRKHRRYGAPKHMTHKGWLTTNDQEKITQAKEGEVIEIEGMPPEGDVNKALAPFQHAPVDPALYDSTPLQQDMMYVIGNQEATQPASNKATATAASINEQSRQQTVGSNVDDLDDFLSTLAENAGQILMREVSGDTVKRIAGPGSLWPAPGQGEDYINELYLDVVASSSGRPNKAIEVANFTQVAPLMIQAGANPQFIIRESLKRLDDRLDPDEAFAGGPSPFLSMPQGTQPAQQYKGKVAPTSNGQNPSQTVPRPALAS